MAYATIANLIELCGERELIQITARADPPADVVDELLAQAALDDASAEIDGYVGRAYVLPLATNPTRFKALCCAIARYTLFPDPTEAVRTRYKDAIAWLTGVSKGTVTIPDATGVSPAGQVSVEVATTGRDRLFTRSSMRDL